MSGLFERGASGRGWIALALVAACGAPAPRAASPAAEARPSAAREASIESATEPARDPCRLEATSAEVLRVAPPGVDPFAVSVSDAELTLAPTDDEEVLSVRATLPLRFEATASIDDQRIVVATEGERAAGAVRLVAGLPISRLRSDGDALSALVQLGRRYPGARRGIELTVGPVGLACADLRAAPSEQTIAHETTLAPVPGGELAIVAEPPLVVRPVRLAPAELRVGRRRADVGPLPVWVLDRVGEHARVVIAFRDGSRVEGWALQSALRPPTDAEAIDVDSLLRVEDRGPFGESLPGVLPHPDPAPEPGAHLGLATVAPDSPIYAEPGDAEWARTPDHPIEARVFWRRDAPYAQLVDVSGVSVHPSRAWVSRDALRLAR